MISLIAAALLAAAQPMSTPASSPPDAPLDPAADLATLQQLYDESCGSRGYGAYDDLCIPLTEQLQAAKRAAQHRAPPRPTTRTAAPVPPPAHASLPPDKPMESGPTQGAPNAPSPTPSSNRTSGGPPTVGPTTPPS